MSALGTDQLEVGDDVPVAAGLEARHAHAPAAASVSPGCVPGGISTSASPSSVGTETRVAERELREADLDLGVQVGAVALEPLVVLDAQDDVEVAGLPAARRRLAPPHQAQRRAVLDAGRDRRSAACPPADRRRCRRRCAQGLRTTRPSPRQTGQVDEIIRKPCECIT